MQDDWRTQNIWAISFSFQKKNDLFFLCAFQAFLSFFLPESVLYECVILCAGASMDVLFCGSRLRRRWNKAHCEC